MQCRNATRHSLHHGETRMVDWPSRLKSVSEPSVWIRNRVDIDAENAVRPGSSSSCDLERRPCRRVVRLIPIRRRPELPGAQLVTYSTKGLLREHENLEPSAGSETPGKPPSPAMSRSRGGAFVVVRARESRVHGEGRQGVGRSQKPEGSLVDTRHRADRAWLLSVQTKLYQWSRQHTGEPYQCNECEGASAIER